MQQLRYRPNRWQSQWSPSLRGNLEEGNARDSYKTIAFSNISNKT